MSDDKVKQFPGDEIDVHWDSRLCIHIGECGRADNALFEAGRETEAIELLETSPDPKAAGLPWLETALDSVTQNEIQNWQFGGSPSPAFAVIDEPGTADVDFIAVSEGIASGSSPSARACSATRKRCSSLQTKTGLPTSLI